MLASLSRPRVPWRLLAGSLKRWVASSRTSSLVPRVKKTGNSLFDSMAAGIKNFRDYIKDGGLEQWFKDAKKFGEDLGTTIKTIGELLDKLDSPGFRDFASLLLSAFANARTRSLTSLVPLRAWSMLRQPGSTSISAASSRALGEPCRAG